MNLAEAIVKVVGDFSGFRRQVTTEGDNAGRTLGSRMGRGLSTAFTAAGAIGGAIAAPLLAAGTTVDSFNDTIRESTGLTGEALESVQQSAANVAGTVPEDLQTIADVTADLQARTGLYGDDLERLTGLVLDYSRVTGTDATTNTNQLTRLFGDWSIATGDQSGALDTLLRVQQETRIEGGRLQELIVKFGGPMRQLGFGFEETAALLGKFEAEGVNTELVMGSMRVALGKMAKAGEEPVETLGRVIEQIQGAGSAGEANALALELFGARAGPDMAAAIREGRFDIDELMGSLEASTETVTGLADETADAGDHIAGFMNNATLAIGPFAEGLAGVSTTLGPVIYALPLLGGAAGKAAGGLANLVTSVGPKLLSGLLGLGPVVAGAGTAIGTAFSAAASAVIAAWPLVLLGLVIAAIVALVMNPELREKALEIGGKIVGAIGEALGAIGQVLGSIIGAVVSWGGQVVSTVAGAMGQVVSFILSVPGRIASWVGSIVGQAASWVGQVVGRVAAGIGQVVGFVLSIPGRVVSWVGSLIGQAASAVAGLVGNIARGVGQVVSYVLGIPGRVASWVGGLIGGAARAAAGFISSIVGMAGDVVRTVIGIPGRAISAVVGGFANIGRQAVDAFLGFIRGIPDAVGNILGGVGDFIGGLIPSFAVGTDYVPRDMLAQVHKGEMIVPAREADAIRSGRRNLPDAGTSSSSGGGLTVNVYNPTPEPASTSTRRELQKRMVLGTV